MKPPPQNPSIKIEKLVHDELCNLAADYKQHIGTFAEALLRYTMRDLARVRAALDEQAAEGARKATERRVKSTKKANSEPAPSALKSNI
jgi:hypothetical protein